MAIQYYSSIIYKARGKKSTPLPLRQNIKFAFTKQAQNFPEIQTDEESWFNEESIKQEKNFRSLIT